MFTTTLNAGTPATLATMIRRAFGDCPAKAAAPYADASHRTVSDWLQRRAEPGAWKLLRMVRHPGFRAELRAYLDFIEMEEANIALQLDNNDPQHLRDGAGRTRSLGTSTRPGAVCATAQGQGAQRREVSK
jgi:hypothetical protein